MSLSFPTLGHFLAQVDASEKAGSCSQLVCILAASCQHRLQYVCCACCSALARGSSWIFHQRRLQSTVAAATKALITLALWLPAPVQAVRTLVICHTRELAHPAVREMRESLQGLCLGFQMRDRSELKKYALELGGLGFLVSREVKYRLKKKVILGPNRPQAYFHHKSPTLPRRCGNEA